MIPEIVLGSVHIPTFFLVISLTLSLLMVFLSSRVERFGKSRAHAFNLALLLMAAGFIGGRLLHVFYEELSYYKADPIQVFYFWNGGFVFYGGMLACWLVGWLYCRIQKIDFLEWADFFAPLFSLSHALGRIGCLLSGCCFGAMCVLPWSIQGRHPTALYLILGELIIFIYLLHRERTALLQNRGPLQRGHQFMRWVFLHCLLRFEVEYFRDDFRGQFFTLPVMGTLSISQVICLLFMITAAAFFIVSFGSSKKLYTRPPS